MANILIVDDTRFTGMFLKRALENESHDVVWVPNEEHAMECWEARRAGLVLVNQTCRNYSGWTVFNRLKQINLLLPIMLYLLDDFKSASVTWVIRAVEEAMSTLQKSHFRKALSSTRQGPAAGEPVPIHWPQAAIAQPLPARDARHGRLPFRSCHG